MTGLQVRFIPQAEIAPELQGQIEALDHLAFADDAQDDDVDFSSIQWAAPDWMALGFLQGELITQLCLPKREITVSTQKMEVAGIGGMATHPKYQHKGYGSQLLAATQTFMRDRMSVSFGLLICANATRPFYELAGWQFAGSELFYWQEMQQRILKTCVMTLSLDGRAWPTGHIDLCGSPW